MVPITSGSDPGHFVPGGSGSLPDANAFLVGPWKLGWDGPSKGTEAVQIDECCNYNFQDKRDNRYLLEPLKFISGKRIVFVKHFLGTNRASAVNDLEIRDNGKVMTGTETPGVYTVT